MRLIFRWCFVIAALAVLGALIWYASAVSCLVRRETRTVRGDSLFGVLKSGTRVEVLFGYYECRPIRRGDVVAYRFGGNQEPLVKIVRGITGDELALRSTGMGYEIMVNGAPVMTSEGVPYIVGEAGFKLLSLYVRDFEGVIPKDSYLILGNLAGGSRDSSQFGLVSKSDIVGKVRWR